jgi:glycosidase
MTGAADPDNRRMMRFGNQLSNDEREDLTDVRNLIKLRRMNPALVYGDYLSLQADKDIFAYIRSDLNERVLVVLNKNTEKEEVNLSLPVYYGVTKLVDLLSGENIDAANNKAEISVKGIGYRFFKLESK